MHPVPGRPVRKRFFQEQPARRRPAPPPGPAGFPLRPACPQPCPRVRALPLLPPCPVLRPGAPLSLRSGSPRLVLHPVPCLSDCPPTRLSAHMPVRLLPACLPAGPRSARRGAHPAASAFPGRFRLPRVPFCAVPACCSSRPSQALPFMDPVPSGSVLYSFYGFVPCFGLYSPAPRGPRLPRVLPPALLTAGPPRRLTISDAARQCRLPSGQATSASGPRSRAPAPHNHRLQRRLPA